MSSILTPSVRKLFSPTPPLLRYCPGSKSDLNAVLITDLLLSRVMISSPIPARLKMSKSIQKVHSDSSGPAYLTASPPGSNSWTLDASATSTPAPAHWEQSPTSSTFQSGAEASTYDGQEPTRYEPSSDDTYSPDEYNGGATSFANTTAVQPSGPPPSSP